MCRAAADYAPVARSIFRTDRNNARYLVRELGPPPTVSRVMAVCLALTPEGVAFGEDREVTTEPGEVVAALLQSHP